MRRRTKHLVGVMFAACALLLFQNFQYSSSDTKPSEKTILPSTVSIQDTEKTLCRSEDEPVALVRVVGLRTGHRVSISWNDYLGERIVVQNVLLPLSLGNCPVPSGSTEFKVCPDQMGRYLDLRIKTEDNEVASLSAPLGTGCERSPFVLDVALQGGPL